MGDGANREPAICRADVASFGDREALDESATIGGSVDRATVNHGNAIRDSLKEEEEDELDSISPPALDTPAARRDLPPRELPEPAQAQVERILAATAGLFGEAVHGPPTRYPDPRRLLAAIAHIYSRRQGLRKPARVVYSMLRDGIPPPEHLLTDPLAYLPADYLQAAGLPVPERAEGAEPGGWADEAEWENENSRFTHSQDFEAELPHASLSLPVLEGAGRLAVEVLRSEMPRQAYEKHLRPACLLRFDPGGYTQAGGSRQAGDPQHGGCLFTVQVGDDYSREWLAQRVGRSLSRTLEGICQRPARVEFVAPP